jgi:nitrogen fixation protein FixH
MSMQASSGREFTGRHLLLILIAFFGVVIAVNLTMAYLANSTWTGLVVNNSYVASQEFNAKAAQAEAQIARGWTYELDLAGGQVRFVLKSANGAPISAKAVKVTFKRPVSDREDVTIDLARGTDGRWQAPHPLAPGAWIAVIDADVGEAEPWRETMRLLVKSGE